MFYSLAVEFLKRSKTVKMFDRFLNVIQLKWKLFGFHNDLIDVYVRFSFYFMLIRNT